MDAAIVIRNGTSMTSACAVTYNLSRRGFFLLADDAKKWFGPVDPGSSAILSNSQCQLNAANSTLTTNGATVTVNADLTFTGSFAGPKDTLVFYQGDWRKSGTWSVPKQPKQLGVSVMATASSGSAARFMGTFVYDGSLAGVNDAAIMLANGPSYAGSCAVSYSVYYQGLLLINDAGDAWLGPLTPGSSAKLQNSVCTLDGATSSVAIDSTSITATFGLTFDPRFVGAKYLYGYYQGVWLSTGTWTITN